MPQDSTGPTAEDASRSGKDVREAVDRAVAGTPSSGVQTPPDNAKPHTAPVEQVRDDEAMTQGQVVDGPGTEADVPTGPDHAAAGSGGAQSQVGARVSDRMAGGDEPASGSS